MPATWDQFNNNGYGQPNHVVTWVYHIMEQLEQKPLREKIDQIFGPKPDGMGPDAYLYNNQPWSIVSTIKVVQCPSDPADETPSLANPQDPSCQISYAMNGGVPDGHPDSGFQPHPQYGFDWTYNGASDNRLKGTLPTETHKLYYTSLADINSGDGQTNTILIAENSDLEDWNYAPTEFHACIVWDNYNWDYSDPQYGPRYTGGQFLNKNPVDPVSGIAIEKPATLRALYLPQQNPTLQSLQAVLPYTRPYSGHPTGFMLAFADGHVAFVNEAVDYRVYARLMTSNGKKYLPASQKPPQLSGHFSRPGRTRDAAASVAADCFGRVLGGSVPDILRIDALGFGDVFGAADDGAAVGEDGELVVRRWWRGRGICSA